MAVGLSQCPALHLLQVGCCLAYPTALCFNFNFIFASVATRWKLGVPWKFPTEAASPTQMYNWCKREGGGLPESQTTSNTKENVGVLHLYMGTCNRNAVSYHFLVKLMGCQSWGQREGWGWRHGAMLTAPPGTAACSTCSLS